MEPCWSGNALLDTLPSSALGMSGWWECGRHKRLTRSSRVRGQKLRVSRDLSDRLFSRFIPRDRPLSPFTPSDRVVIVTRGPGMIGTACFVTPPSEALGVSGGGVGYRRSVV